MALERWEPFAEMRTLRSMMEDMFERPFALTRFLERGLIVPVDMYETDSEIRVRASLPGVKPEDVDINIVGNLLTIRGEAKAEERVERENYIMQERRFGSFLRSLTLPTAVSPEKAQARFVDGVLRLSLPKSEEAKPKRFKVQSRTVQ